MKNNRSRPLNIKTKYGTKTKYETSEIGERLNSIRNSRNITWENLSLDSGVSLSYLWKLRHSVSEPRIGTILRLSEVLKCSPGWLAFGE